MRLGHKRPDHEGHTREEDKGGDHRTTGSLEAWITELAIALGIDETSIDRDQVLEVSKSMHRVTRAAAPFTLLLIGLAAGLNGGSREAINQATTTVQRLAASRRPEPPLN